MCVSSNRLASLCQGMLLKYTYWRVVMIYRFIILATILSQLYGCSATPYQKFGSRGGYTDAQLSENIFKVSFHGNARTHRERATDFALLRSAEIAEAHGFRYFSIIDKNSYTTQRSVVIPGEYETRGTFSGNTYSGTTTYTGSNIRLSLPSTANTIICFNEKPEGFYTYSTTYVIKGIKGKYGIE